MIDMNMVGQTTGDNKLAATLRSEVSRAQKSQHDKSMMDHLSS